jgi:hypothetical protein
MDLRHVLLLQAGRSEKAESFRSVIGLAHKAVFTHVAPKGIKPVKVVAILAKDFAGEVEQVFKQMDFNDEPLGTFNTERLGGSVQAKTMSLNPESSEIHIVFNEEGWPTGGDLSFAYNLNIAIHEMTHALMARLRWQCGLLEGIIIPSRTPSELARSISRIAAEEYWVDSIAGRAVGVCGTATIDGVTRPICPLDFHDTTHRAGFSELLNKHVHPSWADEVNSYRIYQQSLDDMWEKIVNTTGQVFTLLAHAECEADFLERPGPLEDEHKEHPATRLYLGSVWSGINIAMRERPLIPNLETFKKDEEKIISVGQQLIVEMWGRLGLTFEERGDRTFALWVAEPLK